MDHSTSLNQKNGIPPDAIGWMEVFKTGTHTDSKGTQKTWTESDLDNIVAKYNPAEHEAPIVIGHPTDNSPAYGWIGGLKREGEKLFARAKNVVPEFKDWVGRGLYKKRSISLYPDMTLRHVGFLGGMPPAVKGLADMQFVDVQFEEGKEMVYEFNQKSSIINHQFNEGGDEMPELKELQEELKKLQTKLAEREAQVNQFSEKDKAREAENLAMKKEIVALQKSLRKSDFESFCEGLIDQGRMTPVMKTMAMDFMEILQGTGEYEFAEGGKKPALEQFKGFLSGLPKQVEFSEVATKKRAGGGAAGGTAGEKLEKLTKEKLATDKNLTYRQAFSEVQAANPDLTRDYEIELGR